jgi:hypothetical protein
MLILFIPVYIYMHMFLFNYLFQIKMLKYILHIDQIR